MGLHPALKSLIHAKIAHAHVPQWDLPIDAVRAAFRELWTPAITGEPDAVSSAVDISIPGGAGSIPARVYTPLARDVGPLLLYLHGGGYVKGRIEESDAFCRGVANVTGRTVVSIDTIFSRAKQKIRKALGVDDVSEERARRSC